MRQRFAAVSSALLLASSLSAQKAELRPLPEDRRPGFEAIDPALCREWLTYLASDELGGRETGTPGYQKAAEFVAKNFEAWGLKPVGDDGTYFQQVPFVATSTVPDKTRLVVEGLDGEALREVRAGEGLGGQLTSAVDQTFELMLLVAESGEDVQGADVSGKAVVFVDRSPRGQWGYTEASMALRRARAGALLTVDDGQAGMLRPQVQYSRGEGRVRTARFRRPNRYALSRTAAKRLLAASGLDVTSLDAKGAVVETALDVKLHAIVAVETKPTFGANVVGLLEGRDPALSQEIVGIGSHLDHIGVSASGEVNNGADDDGSGTTGVMAVARAFAKNPLRPRRSLLFMCFAAEEKGLLGSRFYVDHPIFPNANMVAEIQMDMIGRHEEKVDRRTGKVTEKAEDNVNTLHLVGTKKLSQEFHDICVQVNAEHVGFEFEYDEEGVFYRSDHVNFARKNIPIAFLFTGFHAQYHRPGDTVDRIDFPKLARVSQLAYGVAFEVAERDVRPKVDRAFEDIQRPGRRRR